MEYRALFKCRLCGETYKDAMTTGKRIAESATILASIGKSEVNGPSLYGVHCCKNGGFGISDFLGFDVKEEG